MWIGNEPWTFLTIRGTQVNNQKEYFTLESTWNACEKKCGNSLILWPIMRGWRAALPWPDHQRASKFLFMIIEYTIQLPLCGYYTNSLYKFWAPSGCLVSSHGFPSFYSLIFQMKWIYRNIRNFLAATAHNPILANFIRSNVRTWKI